MKNITLILALITAFCSYSQELANYSFDNAGSITNWVGVVDAANADAIGTNPLASLDFNASGNGTGALEISGFSDGNGKAFIFELLNTGFDYQGSGDINIAFDVKFVGPYTSSAFHFLTFTSGAGDTNFFDLQGQINNSSWSNLDVDISGITNANTTLKISFQIAAGAIFDAGGTVLIDNIVITGNASSCSDGIQNGDEEGIDCGGSCTPCTPDPDDPVFDNLVWSDEFDGTGAINSTNWFHQTQLPAGGSWYNGEVQHYTNREDNTYVSDGTLKIVAKKESFNDQGHTKGYTSARLNSKFTFTYGRVEVRAKLPTGVGTWPAIWMLGKNINEDGGYWDNEGFGTTNWPACGEIDIMEHWGTNQNFVQSAMHTPSSYGGTINHGGQTISTASTQFHVYALEWSEEKMVFSVDGVKHYTYNPASKNSSTWPFDIEQYMLLNIAIQPSIDAGFTQSSMEIDYVRIYQESALSIVEEQLLEDVILYPNPVRDVLQIKSESLLNKIEVYSVFGNKIKEFRKNLNSIYLGDIAKGVYVVKLYSEFGYTTKKIIKK